MKQVLRDNVLKISMEVTLFAFCTVFFLLVLEVGGLLVASYPFFFFFLNYE